MLTIGNVKIYCIWFFLIHQNFKHKMVKYTFLFQVDHSYAYLCWIITWFLKSTRWVMYIGILWPLLTSFPSSTFNSIMSKRVIFLKHESDHMSICILYGYGHSCSTLSLSPRERDQVKKKKKATCWFRIVCCSEMNVTSFNTKKLVFLLYKINTKGVGADSHRLKNCSEN